MKKRKLLKRCRHCKNTGFAIKMTYHWGMPVGYLIDSCGWCIHGYRKRRKTIIKKNKELLALAIKITGLEKLVANER